MYPPLPGARAEAIAVATRLTGGAGRGVGAARVRALTIGNDDDAQTVINALFERAYRIVHVAGHGAPGRRRRRGAVGQDTYLGPHEVRHAHRCPSWCSSTAATSPARDAAAVLEPYDRAAFAANVAEELIRVGVRCVIAAGWAVEDEPAEDVRDHVLRRAAAAARASSTPWPRRAPRRGRPRRQHLGGVPVLWRSRTGRWRRAGRRRAAAGGAPATSSPASRRRWRWCSRWRTIAIACMRSESAQRGRADRHSARCAARQDAPPRGAVRAAVGRDGRGGRGVRPGVRGRAAMSTSAIEWYRSALDAEDGSASFKAAEQLGNQLVRQARAIRRRRQGAQGHRRRHPRAREARRAADDDRTRVRCSARPTSG